MILFCPPQMKAWAVVGGTMAPAPLAPVQPALSTSQTAKTGWSPRAAPQMNPPASTVPSPPCWQRRPSATWVRLSTFPAYLFLFPDWSSQRADGALTPREGLIFQHPQLKSEGFSVDIIWRRAREREGEQEESSLELKYAWFQSQGVTGQRGVMRTRRRRRGRRGGGWAELKAGAWREDSTEESENMPVLNIHNEDVYDNFAMEGRR